jgi:hypothetical protein
MRRSFHLLLCIMLLIFLFPSTIHAAMWKENGVLLQLNRSYILYSQQQMPYVDKNGRVLIPLRLVGDLMGAKVSWNANQKEAVLSYDHTVFKLQMNQKTAYVSGQAYMMDTIPVLTNATVMIPVRILSEVLNIPVEWDQKYKIVTLKDERFLKAKSLDRLEEMENFDEKFKGKIIPRKIQFVKGQNNDNKLTFEVFNYSDETIHKFQLHKNIYFYRSETSSGMMGTRGFTASSGMRVCQ